MNKQLKLLLMSAAVIVLTILISNSAYADNAFSGEVIKETYVRNGPTENDARLCKLPKDKNVIILGQEHGWFKAAYNGCTGYIMAQDIVPYSYGDSEYGYGKVVGSSVRVRSSPSITSSVKATLANGRCVSITGIQNGWYKIKYGNITGFIHPDYVQPEKIPYTIVLGSGYVPENQRIVATAKRYLGVKYTWGGMSPIYGFDCSGFTQYVFEQCGYTLQNRTRQHTNGVSVKYAELQPGDLVFFDTNRNRTKGHVGIYIGNGEFIHAPRTGKPVQISSMAPGSYYRGLFVCARRIV